jgi:hypothetical protein
LAVSRRGHLRGALGEIAPRCAAGVTFGDGLFIRDTLDAVVDLLACQRALGAKLGCDSHHSAFVFEQDALGLGCAGEP